MEALQNCEACNDTKLWCRVCGGWSKRKKHGYREEEIDLIYEYQFGSCQSFVIRAMLSVQQIYKYILGRLR